MLKVTRLGRWNRGSPLKVWESMKDTLLVGVRRGWGGSRIHLCHCSSPRVTELALTVERLQNQNVEKDRVNKALTEKLEALVRCT